MSFLIDTNVLSEQSRPVPNPSVVTWFRRTDMEDLHLSVITIGEVRRGITQLLLRRDQKQAARYTQWLATTIREFGQRIVDIDIEIAERWGEQHARRPTAIADGLIGATAAAHGWTLVTRNTKDFAHLDIPLLNPFSEEVDR